MCLLHLKVVLSVLFGLIKSHVHVTHNDIGTYQ